MENRVSNNSDIDKLNILSIFDFDGTLTYHDSFIRFLFAAFNKYYFLNHIFQMWKPTIYYILGKLKQDELKAKLIKLFLSGINEQWLCYQAEVFCKNYWEKLMRPDAILSVILERNSGAEVTICSASPSIVVKPFADQLGIKLIGTQLEVKDGFLTGNIIGYNCRGYNKVARLKHVYGNLSNYHIRVWGDTTGDYELLKIAQDPHWRLFQKKSVLKKAYFQIVNLTIINFNKSINKVLNFFKL